MKKRILSMILALAMVLSLGLSVFAEGEETQADIVDAAFALESGASLEGTKTLTGEVSYIVTAYSEKFDNVTVNIHVLDGSGNQKTIQCYQMKGDDAATVGVGDVITVTGIIKNYKGTVEFDSGCTFVTVSKAGGDYAIKTFAGYAPGDVAILVRQEGKTTVSDVTGGKDYNAYALIVCNADGKVIDLDLRGPGRPAGVKGEVEVPEGGFIIAINRDVADYPIHVGSVDGAEAFIADGVAVGDEIELIGVDLEALATAAAQTALTGASFNLVHYDEIPEGAVAITHFANYGTNVSSVFFRIGEAKTIGEISAITYGESKTFAWSNAVVVDAEGKIINIVPSAEDADKTNLEVPEGGFIITGHGSSAAASAINGVVLGGTITLVNVDEAALVAGETAVELTNAAFVYTEPEVERPISYQKPYTVAKANGAATYWSNTAGTVTLDDDGVIITDGKYGSLAGDTKGNYVALNGLREKINDEFTYYAGIFVVDLGESYYVDKFDVHTAAQTGWGISQAKYIVVSYSTDGENFTQAGVIEGDGEIFNGTGSGWTAYYQELQLDESVSARYVKFEVTTWTQFLWIAEVEVWEGEEPEPMGDTTIDGVFDDDIWADVEWTTYDGYTKGTWQQYQKKGTYTYKTALAEDDDYIYFAGEVSCLNVTQIRLWFRTNPEASLYTHFVDVFSDGRHFIKKNSSLTENKPSELANHPEYALIEVDGKTRVEIKVAKSDLDMNGDYDFIPQASVDGLSNLLGAEIIHGNFVFGGATMTYFPWVGWPAAPEETYVGLIPVTNHWIFTDITSGDTVGVINKAHYERQEDGSLRFVVGGTDLYPLVTYYYEEAKVYNVARGTLNYKFTLNGHNTNITFIFEGADGTPYSFPLANTALGLESSEYNAGTGDILPGTYEGSVALADLVASASLYGNNPFPEADATELKFTGIQIYACGITDPAGGVYIDDLSVTVEASEPITEKIFDLEAEKVVGTITFTAEDPTLETIRISGSIDGEEYYDLNSNGNVAVADGVATLNIASKGYIKVRYIKVEGTNVNGTLELEEPALPDDAVVVPPAGPYPMTGLNGAGYGIAYFTAEDAPEGFGLNAQDVFYSNDKPIKLNSAIITIAQKVDEGVYQILWNDCNGWSKETGAAHFNTPEGVEGIDYHDDKVFLAEDQIVFVIMSSGGYATANDGVYSTGKWILRGLVAGNYLRLTEDTAELFINQPAAVASQEELSIADFDQDGDIDSDDAIYLLRAVLFPEDYEITLAAPFYGDRNPTSDDAIYLLRHVLFPKDYPLPLE